MTHYFCKGECGGHLDVAGVCEAENCSMQWQLMEECNCVDGKHGLEQVEQTVSVKDAHGNELKDGDSVALIKDLTLRGSSQVIKIGTKVKNIKLTDDPDEVDCKINGTAIVLRTEFLKKL